MPGFEPVGSKRYRLLHPRPVYIIIASRGEKINAMAASWVSPLSEEPERITLALDKESYTYQIIREVREFTVNVVDDRHLDVVWCVGTTSGHEIDKVSRCGLKLEPSSSVRAPHLADALGYIEARVYKIIEDVAEDVDLIVADVVAAYARSDVYNPRYGWELAKARILLHASGRAFTVPGRLLVARG
ncbi:FMN-binding flavin reductase domain protein [Pyrolobus fumarii 1A]|uniref:FMN-binding flavin reductase domain protein n=1 Tax=Pyrolobus fumarii (strain DSM 11204 / 1A) TaxID=694429 RepID=G0EEC5_PYRF1|nr:flavin reductase family protein [Pyrolobus fumarii]AEM38819.1 FMN-binding flavin reductase domain protein [Pyrolobus fumarii 1A]